MASDREACALHYAVIEAIRSDAPPELFVISYTTEQSLRLVIADFCIVATGFSTRNEALGVCEAQVYSAA